MKVEKIIYAKTTIKKGKFIFFIAHILMKIAHFMMGIRSGYPMCCILAFVFDKERYYVEGIERSLCKECFIKLLNYTDFLTLREEKSSISDLFIHFKNDIETFYLSHLTPPYNIPLNSFIGNIPFYRSQQDKLRKLGIIVLNPNSKENNQIPVSMKMRMNYTFLMIVLNKYYIGVYDGSEHRMIIEFHTIQKQKIFDSIEEVEEMLKELIDFAKFHFHIMLDENIIDFSKYKAIWED